MNTSGPFQPVPLPLLNGSVADGVGIIDQPVDLSTLTERYTNVSIDFIRKSVAVNSSFFLYHAYAHTHVPQFSSPRFLNSSARGIISDGVAEMDWSVGQLLDVISELAPNTLVMFASDNGPDLIQGVNGGKRRDGLGLGSRQQLTPSFLHETLH
jgi:arylsulfatase A-like enzyme